MTTEQKDRMAQGRQQAKERRAAEKLMSTGVGESKIFRDPDAPQEDSKLLDCHINGRLIRDLNFTPLQLAALSWHHTDEGFAARNEGKSSAGASVTMDPLQKTLQKRRDDVLDRGMETWEATNAMQEQIDKYGRPGFKTRYLSDDTVQKKGMRGWQPVINEHGDPVKLGKLTMAEMPEGKARARNAHYAGLGNERLKQVNRSYLESGGASAVSDQ